MRKITQPKTVQGVLGMDLEKVKAIQHRIDEFTNHMSELLRIERDAELEFTQEELDAVPKPDDTSDSSKPIDFLVSHSQPQQELCDTICNLNAISTSTGLLLFLFSIHLLKQMHCVCTASSHITFILKFSLSFMGVCAINKVESLACLLVI